MTPFLKKLAGELNQKYKKDLSGICIVFPSRRAKIYFQHHLSEEITKPIWSPAIYSIEDFIKKYSPFIIADKLTLIFELYETYKQIGEEEPFDKFYPWGEMLLNDFDEIDKSMINTDYLFRILYEHREIEEDFGLNVSDIEEFNRFWNTFSSKELPGLQQEFIRTWEIMGRVYKNFRQNLLGKNSGYEGMAYRKICEMVKSKKFDPGYEKIIFAGFNLLSESEEDIIHELTRQGQAETYWDADEYYEKNDIQEAGKFLRKNFRDLKIENKEWIENLLKTESKNVKIIGTPLQVSQAKALGNELKLLQAGDEGKTAVVLPDDSLLGPVLHSIPANIGAVNITMGFPFKRSPLYNLLMLLKSLQSGRKGKGGSSVYYHRDVIQILLHSYIKLIAPGEIYTLVNDINKRNIIYLSHKRVLSYFKEAPRIISCIFSAVETSTETMNYLYKITEFLSENERTKKTFDKEYLYKFYTELNHLSDVTLNYSAEINNKTFWKLLAEILKTIKIPFTGEPLEGMQVMGMLETRALDFENVYILSMNEGIMPRGGVHGSFIPYSLRKSFRMPTFEDDDANSAYYFYRLIQRAKNVTLLYNTEAGQLSGGEESRFIMQLESELAAENSGINIKRMLLQAETTLPKRKEITIEKSDDIISLLKNQKYFSASALTDYIRCPLQFYFKRVVKLEEEETAEEFFTGAGFGTILHKIMDILYHEYIGKEVSGELILSLKKKLNDNFDGLWETACDRIPEFEEFKSELQGKNLLYKNVIKKLVNEILESDSKEAPFKITALEHEMEQDISFNPDGKVRTVKLKGVLDRLEEKEGTLRIIDYKSGHIDKKNKSGKSSDEDYINKIYEDIAFKENFQQLFYALLYMNVNPGSRLKIGLYPMREISEGIFWFEEEIIPESRKNLFEAKLKELLSKIFDSTTPFTQTPDIERCKYCPYKSICYRE